ncbi:hypothetical protein BH09PAT2_BH09PAT2_03240 [soil metagenome]
MASLFCKEQITSIFFYIIATHTNFYICLDKNIKLVHDDTN